MPNHVTFCDSCDNVESHSRKKFPGQWLCTKFPRREGMGFVAPDLWVEMEPYMRCVNINGGACPLWTPYRNGQHDNGL
jgi:hypothetical protein